MLYLCEINDIQKAGWCKAIEVVDGRHNQPTQFALFPDDLKAPEFVCEIVNLQLSNLSLHRPRQWGQLLAGLPPLDRLRLDQLWQNELSSGRKGDKLAECSEDPGMLRLISARSEWRLHREWYCNSTMPTFWARDESLAQKDKLYRCLDRILKTSCPLPKIGFRHQAFAEQFTVQHLAAKHDPLLLADGLDQPFGYRGSSV